MAGYLVQPEVLKSQILDIRRALSDDPKNPRFIETLPKRGYQFMPPVAEASAPATLPAELPSQASLIESSRAGLLQDSSPGMNSVSNRGKWPLSP